MPRKKDRQKIACAYCGAKFADKEEWLAHIPCKDVELEISSFDVGNILPNVQIAD